MRGSGGTGSVKVLVTGSTGFVGRHVVPALVEAGHAVRCLHRPTSDLTALEGLEVELAEGNVLLPETLARAMRGVDAVVHLVAILRARESSFEEINVEGVRNVARACLDAGVEKAVHMGSLGTAEHHPTRYGRTKALGEGVWRNGEVGYVVLRPSLILGPGGFLTPLVDLIRRYERVPVVGSGENAIQPICVADVARATVAALRVRHRRTYELVGPDRMTWDGFVLRVAESLGLTRSLRHVPPSLALLASLASRLTRGEPLVTRDEVHYLQQDLVGGTEDFQELTGRPPSPLEGCLDPAVAALASGD